MASICEFVRRAFSGLHWSFWGVLSLARVSGWWAHPGLARGVPLVAVAGLLAMEATKGA